jgi:hypothetical protein
MLLEPGCGWNVSESQTLYSQEKSRQAVRKAQGLEYTRAIEQSRAGMAAPSDNDKTDSTQHPPARCLAVPGTAEPEGSVPGLQTVQVIAASPFG